MNLVSGPFLLFFLPGVILAFSLCRKFQPRLAAPLLLAASALFYAVEDPTDLPLLVASIIFNYWIAGRIAGSGSHRRLWIFWGVALNLLPLIWYKYQHLVIADTSNAGLPMALIPLGLSFYTLRQISYLFDIQRKDALRLSFSRYALFAGFFAQIPAGPVSRYHDLAPQIAAVGETEVPLSAILRGLSLFFFGLFKKIVFADKLGMGLISLYATVSAGKPLTFPEAWLTAWATLLELYFDFSGYSDMAIGIGLCLGLSLPVNFNSPLKAMSGSEFIDRWHMSLVSWIREYLYQPVFQIVRKAPWGAPNTRRVMAWVLATIVSMGVMGAWHGSQLTLLVSGLLSGVLLVLLQLPGLITSAPWRTRTGTVSFVILRNVERVVLLALLCVLGLAIKTDRRQTMVALLHDMSNWRSVSVSPHLIMIPGLNGLPIRFDGFLPDALLAGVLSATILVGTLTVFLAPNTMQIFGLIQYSRSSELVGSGIVQVHWRPTLTWAIAIGLLAAIEVMAGGDGSGGFIYARF